MENPLKLSLKSRHRWTIRAARFGSVYETAADALRNPELKPVAEAFIANVTRIRLMAELAAMIAAVSLRQQTTSNNWMTNMTKAFSFKEKEVSNSLREFARECRDANTKDDMSRPLHPGEKLMGFATMDDAAQNFPEVVRAIDAVFASEVTGLYTAYEALVEGMALASIKNFPSKFAYNRNMEKNFGFRSRTRQREAYKVIFSVDDSDIVSILHHDAVNALALLRNVIVHKAGFADEEFRKYSTTVHLLGPYHDLNNGDEILFSGAILTEIFKQVMQCCKDLIHSVDTWLVNH